MGFFKNLFTRKNKEHNKASEPIKVIDSVPEVKDEVKAEAKAEPAKKADKRFTETMRQRKLKAGIGMLDVNGNYLSPYDVRLKEVQGCDMDVLADLLIGEVPDHAPHAKDQPHPLSDEYKAMKAKEKEERNAKAKAVEAAAVEVVGAGQAVEAVEATPTPA